MDYISTRLVLRQSDENTYVTLGVARDGLGAEPPAGRGVMSGGTDEVQIAVVGGCADVAGQGVEIEQVSEWLRQGGARVAPSVRRLEEVIPAGDMPDHVGGEPVLGVSDVALEPIGFARRGTLLVAGMAGAGRTTALIAFGHSLRRHLPDAPVYYIGARRSAAVGAGCWERAVFRTGEVGELLAEVTPLLEQPAETGVPVTLVIEGITDFAGSEVEMGLAAAIRAAKRNDHLVIAEASSTTWSGMCTPAMEVRNGRRGIVLQPSQEDGASLLRANFPLIRAGQYPPGRGIYVNAGVLHKVQVPWHGEA